METVSINSRIKALRKAKKLSQAELGEAIGLKQGAVSNLEKEGNTVTEQNIQMICQKFQVRRAWLVDGVGKMHDSLGDMLFSDFAKEHNLNPAEQALARTILLLSPEERQQVLKHVTQLVESVVAIREIIQSSQSKAQKDADIDTEVEAYRQELETEQSAPKGKLHHSEDTDGIIA